MERGLRWGQPALRQRSLPLRSQPASLPAEPAAAACRRAPKRWPKPRIDAAGAVLGAEPQAVGSRSESADALPLHLHPPRRRLRLLAPVPVAAPGPVGRPTGRGRTNPESERNRRSSSALVGREEADETMPAPERQTPAKSGHGTESGGFNSMRETGLEPARYYYHQALNLARLPIPPFPQRYDRSKRSASQHPATCEPHLTPAGHSATVSPLVKNPGDIRPD